MNTAELHSVQPLEAHTANVMYWCTSYAGQRYVISITGHPFRYILSRNSCYFLCPLKQQTVSYFQYSLECHCTVCVTAEHGVAIFTSRFLLQSALTAGLSFISPVLFLGNIAFMIQIFEQWNDIKSAISLQSSNRLIITINTLLSFTQ